MCNYLVNNQICSEKTNRYSGEYIKPNEFSPLFYQKIIALAKNTLISVGTFRSVINFTLGSFHKAVFLDIDEAICEFNRHHLDLIKEIASIEGLSPFEQRCQYLAALHVQWLPKDIVTTSIKIADLLEKLKVLPQNLAGLPPRPRTIVEEMLHQGIKLNQTNPCNWLTDIAKSLADFKHDESSSPYYWEDDEQWVRLVSAIKEERISIIQANVAGEEAMPSLAKYLSEHNEKVSVIDISNVPDYLLRSHVDTFISNVERLPLDSEFRLLFTAQGMEINKAQLVAKKPYNEDWNYYYLFKNQLGILKDNCFN